MILEYLQSNKSNSRITSAKIQENVWIHKAAGKRSNR